MKPSVGIRGGMRYNIRWSRCTAGLSEEQLLNLGMCAVTSVHICRRCHICLIAIHLP